jgi:hypothetical protein
MSASTFTVVLIFTTLQRITMASDVDSAITFNYLLSAPLKAFPGKLFRSLTLREFICVNTRGSGVAESVD